MRVTIFAGSQSFFMEIGLRETIVEIKRKIEQITGISVISQTLSVSGWELVDGLDMEDYPIVHEGTKIDLTIKPLLLNPFHISDKLWVTIKFPSRQVRIQIDSTETVHNLKEKIHMIEGIPIRRMTLFYSGTELDEDFRNLTEYGIHESCEIIVFQKTTCRLRDEPPVRWLSLVVQTSSSLMNSARIPLEMKDSSTVNELRDLLLSRKILPMDDYLFIHKQRIMRDSCSLKLHGVNTGDSLYVFQGTVSRTAS